MRHKSSMKNIPENNHKFNSLALTTTIEYVREGTVGKPRSQKYKVTFIDLKKDVIIEAKKLVIPVARRERLTFDDIRIVGDFPSLYLDKYAFEQVFFNLFTNAIKYREKNSLDNFIIKVECSQLESFSISTYEKGKQNLRGYLIKIEDNGIGIEDGEREKIFLFGFRRKDIERFDVRSWSWIDCSQANFI